MPRPKTPEDSHAQRVSISFEPEQLNQLLDYCQRNDRTMSWVVRRALAQWLEEHKGDTL